MSKIYAPEPAPEALWVLELFSGIGGMHASLNETGEPFYIIGSYEMCPNAVATYHHNFAHKAKFKQQSIMRMTTKTFEDFTPDLIVMSPPCQPFTRQGLKQDIKDSRCSPLLHLLSLLKETTELPKMILLENVSGFQTSEAHAILLGVLLMRGYHYQEYMITPSQLGIPNSRLRYYCIAKLRSTEFKFPIPDQIQTSFPVCTCYRKDEVMRKDPATEKLKCPTCDKLISRGVSNVIRERFASVFTTYESEPRSLTDLNLPLSHFLEPLTDPTPYLVEMKTLSKYWGVFDIVNKNTIGSCCFTRGYTHFVQGTGSIIHHNLDVDLMSVFEQVRKCSTDQKKCEELLASLQLRYFTPKEVARLMCFPENYSFPEFKNKRQVYKSLGNSLNVFVVTLLLSLLLE